MLFERKEMAVACNDRIGLGELGAFQDTVIRFDSEDVEMRPGFQDGGRFADGLQESVDFFIGPFKLGSELVGGLGQDGDRSE